MERSSTRAINFMEVRNFIRSAFTVAIVLTFAAGSLFSKAALAAPENITIDLNSHKVTDGAPLIKSYFQGASRMGILRPLTAAKLKAIGFSRLRIINWEQGNEFNKEGSLNSPRLDTALDECARYSLTPHIIVGIRSQINAPMITGEEYKKYGTALISHIIDRGFNKFEVEVGNEPDVNGNRWLIKGNSLFSSVSMYRAYVDLYSTWSSVITEILSKRTNINIQLGGPAITPYSINHGQVNWINQFPKDVARLHLKMDFFSYHFYGNNGNIMGLSEDHYPYPSFETQILEIRDSINRETLTKKPIFLSEWGPSYVTDNSPMGLINATNIGASWAARFAVSMLNIGIEQATFLAINDVNNRNKSKDNISWPAYFSSDGETPKALYWLAKLFCELPGNDIVQSSERASISGIASQNHNEVSAIIYNQNYNFPQKADLSTKTDVRVNIKNISADLKNASIKICTIVASHGEGFTYRCTIEKAPPVTSNGTLTLSASLSPSSVISFNIRSGQYHN